MKANRVLEIFLLLCMRLRPQWFKQMILRSSYHLLLIGIRIRSLLTHLYMHVYIVSGIEKQTHQKIYVVYAGSTDFPVFISNILFSKKPTVQNTGKVCIWNIKKLKKRYADGTDMILISMDQWYQRFLYQEGFLVFPHMIDMILDTSKDLKILLKDLPHSTIEDVKKVEKKGFNFEISSDTKKIEMFYHNMYLPTIKNRYAETDVLTPGLHFFEYLKELGYKLMMISYNGKEVSGVFFCQQKNQLLLKYAGALEGDISLIKKGVFSAFYYFFMIYAKQQNVDIIDFEGVRPFYHDGLFQYKQKWNMKVQPYTLLKEIFGLYIIKREGPVKQFLYHNPFIGLTENNELIGYVFTEKDKITSNEKKRYEKTYNTLGIKELQYIKI